jgi:hypothetical protein
MRTRWLLAVSLLVLGCATEAPVPEKPTWAEDVLPILRANCFHCHGATALSIRDSTKLDVKRWDIYDLSKPGYADIGFGEVPEPPTDPNGMKVFLSANTQAHFLLLVGFVKPDAPDEVRMPPPPATRLSARDIEVLEKWGETGFTEGTHSPNAKPTISWIEKGKRYQVLDGNGDQVLGRLDCGGTLVQIPRSGGHNLPSDASPPCTATLYDGFATTTADLK